MPVSPDSASDHTALQERIIELETEQKKLREECQSLGLLYEQAEKRRREEARLLRICHVSTDLRGLMQELALFFQDLTECQAVGIRLRLGDDFPYFETRGFPLQFVQSENFLCARNPFGELLRDNTGNPILDCMCGNIIGGRFAPDKPFFQPPRQLLDQQHQSAPGLDQRSGPPGPHPQSLQWRGL